MKGKATLTKKMGGWTGDARMYRCDPPMPYTGYDDKDNRIALTADFVIVSATYALYSGPQTYIFPADGNDVTDWEELAGSFRGSIDHARALRNAGYEEIG